MKVSVLSATLVGIDAQRVFVEADILHDLPKCTIVGLPDSAVQEARERIRSAITNTGLPFPRTRITVNLAPADTRKEGSHYDVPIAAAVLAAEDVLPDDGWESRMVVGELSLDGSVRSCKGVLSIALLAKREGITELFVPYENAAEASMIRGIRVLPLASLSQLVDHVLGTKKIVPLSGKRRAIHQTRTRDGTVDFADVRGQEHAKRALEIAAAGCHNILLTGPPGAGKTLLARALTSIQPTLSLQESLEVIRVYSVAGLVNTTQAVIRQRPFRSPHHTASGVALVGGGAVPKPGEVSLAHRGVLFLDEFPEFPRSVLENLRQPLEDGVVTVSRATGSIQYPARFMLVAAMNPCPCGLFGQDDTCMCTASQILKYRKRISGPLLDRIDLHVEVPRVPLDKLTGNFLAESSATVRGRVAHAQTRQRKRFGSRSTRFFNAEMTMAEVKRWCAVDQDVQAFLRQAVSTFRLSARSYFRVFKVARTIADLGGSANISRDHVAEALQYRPKVE